MAYKEKICATCGRLYELETSQDAEIIIEGNCPSCSPVAESTEESPVEESKPTRRRR